MSDKFQYEGQQITARQLRKSMPVYSEGALQSALESGCQDRDAVRMFMGRRENAAQHSRVLAGRKSARLPQSRVSIMPRSEEWA